MAKKVGVSKDAVARVWRAFGLKPHRSESFQLSTDPDFVEKVRDVVGLYLDRVRGEAPSHEINAINRSSVVRSLRSL